MSSQPQSQLSAIFIFHTGCVFELCEMLCFNRNYPALQRACVRTCACTTLTDNQGHYANDGTLVLPLHTSLVTFSLLFSSTLSLLPLTFVPHLCLFFALICSLHPNPFSALVVHVGVSAHMSAPGIVLPLESLYAGLREDINCKWRLQE